LLLVVAACGSVKDAAKDDAGLPDDASIDAPPQLPLTPGREVVGGAGRLTGTTFTFDVQLGHPISQQPITSTTYKVEGNAAIKP
jgi:hypothetical protein